MSRVLVTGGAGRLGRSVVAVLAAAGCDVVSADRTKASGLPAVQIECDLLVDMPAVFTEAKPDYVVHLAGIAVPFSRPDPEIFATNTELAFGVLANSTRTGVQALLMASTATLIGYGAPHGWSPRYLPLDEQHPIEPWHGYALSKQAVEALIAMAVRRDPDGLQLGAFRPCHVISPEEWGGAPMQQGHTIFERLADPALSAVSLFNYVDARDVGEFVIAWLRSFRNAPNGSIFFVGATDSLVREPIAQALARYVPSAADAAAGLNARDPVFSSERASRLLGWRARRSWRTELSGTGGDVVNP